ncbi:MAG: hypothetical protein V2J42_01970 [Wenzhouxiangella sp.]|jgi:hypothetical protein|nr:hypothetical protein [Wenzhouxiangella sp.]
MRSAALQTAQRQSGFSLQRLSLLIGSGVLLAVPLVLFEPAAYWADDPELFRLLRGMATLKLVLAAVAFAAAWWRLGGQPGPRLQVAYVGGVWALSLATGLIWQLALVIPASGLFHGATLALLIAAWRDMEPRPDARRSAAAVTRPGDRVAPARRRAARTAQPDICGNTTASVQPKATALGSALTSGSPVAR